MRNCLGGGVPMIHSCGPVDEGGGAAGDTKQESTSIHLTSMSSEDDMRDVRPFMIHNEKENETLH
jgi:hypothetical protein